MILFVLKVGMMAHQHIKLTALKNQHPQSVHKHAVVGSDVNMQKRECRKATNDDIINGNVKCWTEISGMFRRVRLKCRKVELWNWAPSAQGVLLHGTVESRVDCFPFKILSIAKCWTQEPLQHVFSDLSVFWQCITGVFLQFLHVGCGSFCSQEERPVECWTSPSIQLAGDLKKLVGDLEKLSHCLDAVVNAGINFKTVLFSFLFPFPWAWWLLLSQSLMAWRR